MHQRHRHRSLACGLGADVLVLLTGVTRVALDFGTRWEREVDRLTVTDVTRGLEQGEFPAGSMGPKVESARRFVQECGGRALVTRADRLVEAIAGDDGTWIVPDPGPSKLGLASSLREHRGAAS